MKLVLFDFDGVITDSFIIVTKMFHRIGKKYGLRVDDNADLARLYENNIFDSLREAGLSETEIKEMLVEIREEQKKSDIPVIKGISVLLRNFKPIIITSNLSKIVETYMDRHNLAYDKVLGADYNPSKVNKINEIKEQNSSKQIYYVGDTMGDVIEAKKAGVVSVAVTWGFHTRRQLLTSKPDYIVDSVKELIQLLKK